MTTRGLPVLFGTSAVAVIALHAVGLMLDGPDAQRAVMGAWIVASFVATVAASLVTFRVPGGRGRLAWLFFALASGSWFAGAIVRFFDPGTPSVADVLWLLFAALSIVGIAFRAGRFASFHLLTLDALPVVVAAGAFGYALQLSAGGGTSATLVSTAYLVSYVFLAILASHLVTLQGFRFSIRTGTITFQVGFWLMAFGAMLSHNPAAAEESTGQPGAIFWSTGLLVLAAWSIRRSFDPRGGTVYRQSLSGGGLRSLPAAVAVLVLVIGPALGVGDNDASYIFAAKLIAITALGLRIYLLRLAERRLSDEIRQERDFTAAIFDAGAIVCVVARDGTFVRFNRGCELLTGYSEAEVLGRELWDLVIPPEQIEPVKKRLKDLDDGFTASSGENEWLTRSGERRMLSWSNKALRDANGAAEFIVATGIDITEQRRAEAALEESEQRFRGVVTNLPGAVYRCRLDASWTMEFLSDEIETITGYRAADFIGNSTRSYASVIHPEDEPTIKEAIQDAVRERKPYVIEYRILHADGRVRWVWEKGQGVVEADGDVQLLDGVLFDVTDRKRADEKLARAEERYRTLVEELPLVTYVNAIDEDVPVVYMSPQIEEAIGYTPEEIVADPDNFSELIHPSDRDRVLAQHGRSFARGEPLSTQYRVRARDGRIVWFHDEGSIRRDHDGARFLHGFLLDITEKKRGEEERETLVATLAEKNEQLVELDRMKDEFIALVSHELRTPLTSIQGFLELLIEGEGGEITEEQANLLAIVDRNAKRLQRLVGDLLFVAQVEAGRLVLEFSEVDLRSLATECIETARPSAEQKGIVLDMTAEPVPKLWGDRERLGQLLDNFVSNAIKFTPDKGRVDLRIGAANGGVRLEISDTGIGIPADEQARIFGRFYRTSTATERAIQGTGLGLTIAKAIAEGHGGRVSFESEVGTGTTFRVELPISSDRQASGESTRAEAMT